MPLPATRPKLGPTKLNLDPNKKSLENERDEPDQELVIHHKIQRSFHDKYETTYQYCGKVEYLKAIENREHRSKFISTKLTDENRDEDPKIEAMKCE